MNQTNQAWYCSWWAIVAAFLFFWPLGIVLLILRNNKSKDSVFMGTTNKKLYLILGAVLIFLGLVSFSGSKLTGLFLLAGGIALIVYAEKLTKRAERNRQYIELIVNRGETSVDKIANSCNISYELASKELHALVNRGVLKNTVIDESARTIQMQRAAVQQENRALETEAPEQVSCVCPGCGAKVLLARGTSINCEYCDAPISAK